MLNVLLAIVGAFILQAVFTMIQMRHFSKEFVKLRRRGKVACGRKAGGFRAGAIVMFLIDDDGIIQEAKKMEGVTFMARVKPMEGFAGLYVGDLTGEEIETRNKNLRNAILDAAMTYRKFISGEPITVPPSPLKLAYINLKNSLQRKKAYNN